MLKEIFGSNDDEEECSDFNETLEEDILEEDNIENKELDELEEFDLVLMFPPKPFSFMQERFKQTKKMSNFRIKMISLFP